MVKPDNSMVICPNCAHQFSAISVDDQCHRAKIESELDDLRGIADTLLSDRNTLRAEVAKLREALRRFANIRAGDGDVFSRYDPRTIIRCEVTVADLLAARAALAAQEGER